MRRDLPGLGGCRTALASRLTVARRAGRGAALLLCLASTSARAGAQQAYLDLLVNDAPRGQVIARIDSGDVHVSRSDLERAGLGWLIESRSDADSLVSLASLAPELSWRLDEVRLQLRLNVRADRLRPTVIRLGTARPEGIRVASEPAAFMQYDLRKDGSRPISCVVELGASRGGAALVSAVSSQAAGGSRRLSSTLTIEQPARLRRWILGDQSIENGTLGGRASIAGVGIKRDFGLDPYRRILPSIRSSLIADGPSEVETWLNGRLLRRQPVPPGPVTIEDVPGTVGQGSVRTVIRDRSGFEREVTSSFHLSPRVLARGLSEYDYAFGIRRLHVSKTSWRYGGLAFSGRHRIGLTDHVTVGAFAEAGPGILNGGPSIAMRSPYADVEASGSLSELDGATGQAATITWSALGRPIGFSGVGQWSSARWSTLGHERGAAAPRFHGSAGVTLQPVRRLSVAVRVTRTDTAAEGSDVRADATASLQLSRSLTLLGRASRPWNDARASERRFEALLTWTPGTGGSAQIAHERAGGEDRTTVRMQHSPGSGSGVGYRVERQLGEERGSAAVDYQDARGRYEVRLEDLRGQRIRSLGASGGFVATRLGVHPTRSVRQGLAIVRVGNLRGVRAYLAGREIGRTNSRGEMVVPNLAPHVANRVSIAPGDVPSAFGLATHELLVAPSARGAALASFEVRPVHSVSGRIEIELEGRTLVPSYGELSVSVHGRTEVSPLGRQGEFFFENLSAGRYKGTVLCDQGSLAIELEVPAFDAGHRDLGVVHCEASR